jgi:acyl carrier protein
MERIAALLATDFAVAEGDVRPEASLRDDLDLDSLDLTELLQLLEERVGVEIDVERLSDLHTLGDVADLLARARGDADAPPLQAVAHS